MSVRQRQEIQAMLRRQEAGVIDFRLVENHSRLVLKLVGKDLDTQVRAKVSMMPEDLEKQLRPQEIVDLLAYLSLDRPPDDPKAKRIPGTPR